MTVPRFFADAVITEYGVARLWGRITGSAPKS